MEDRIVRFLLAKIAAALNNVTVDEVLTEAEAYAVANAKPKREKDEAAEAELDAAVEYCYSLYPTKTIRGDKEVSTGKCAADKKKLRKLVKERGLEDVSETIQNYVAECGGRYLKNFSTFLNNFPERPTTPIFQNTESSLYQDVR